MCTPYKPCYEFGSSIWNVDYVGDVRFLRLFREDRQEIFEIGQVAYVKRLKKLGLYSVYERLVRADLIKCWKTFHSATNKGLLDISHWLLTG